MTTLQDLAAVILSTAAEHENSWANQAYAVSINQAARMFTSDEHELRLVSMLLHVCWNEAQDWAEAVHKGVHGP